MYNVVVNRIDPCTWSVFGESNAALRVQSVIFMLCTHGFAIWTLKFELDNWTA